MSLVSGIQKTIDMIFLVKNNNNNIEVLLNARKKAEALLQSSELSREARLAASREAAATRRAEGLFINGGADEFISRFMEPDTAARQRRAISQIQNPAPAVEPTTAAKLTPEFIPTRRPSSTGSGVYAIPGTKQNITHSSDLGELEPEVWDELENKLRYDVEDKLGQGPRAVEVSKKELSTEEMKEGSKESKRKYARRELGVKREFKNPDDLSDERFMNWYEDSLWNLESTQTEVRLIHKEIESLNNELYSDRLLSENSVTIAERKKLEFKINQLETQKKNLIDEVESQEEILFGKKDSEGVIDVSSAAAQRYDKLAENTFFQDTTFNSGPVKVIKKKLAERKVLTEEEKKLLERNRRARLESESVDALELDAQMRGQGLSDLEREGMAFQEDITKAEAGNLDVPSKDPFDRNVSGGSSKRKVTDWVTQADKYGNEIVIEDNRVPGLSSIQELRDDLKYQTSLLDSIPEEISNLKEKLSKLASSTTETGKKMAYEIKEKIKEKEAILSDIPNRIEKIKEDIAYSRKNSDFVTAIRPAEQLEEIKKNVNAVIDALLPVTYVAPAPVRTANARIRPVLSRINHINKILNKHEEALAKKIELEAKAKKAAEDAAKAKPEDADTLNAIAENEARFAVSAGKNKSILKDDVYLNYLIEGHKLSKKVARLNRQKSAAAYKLVNNPEGMRQLGIRIDEMNLDEISNSFGYYDEEVALQFFDTLARISKKIPGKGSETGNRTARIRAAQVAYQDRINRAKNQYHKLSREAQKSDAAARELEFIENFNELSLSELIRRFNYLKSQIRYSGSSALTEMIQEKKILKEYIDNIFNKKIELEVEDVPKAKVDQVKTLDAPNPSRASKDEILVFGSNLEGRHGKGAAKDAVDNFGAKYGQARGLQGNSYAIPTKDLKANKALPLDSIKKDIDEFLDFAEANPDKNFFFSAIGTGLAGYKPEDIAQLISRTPVNVRFDNKISSLIKSNSTIAKKVDDKLVEPELKTPVKSPKPASSSFGEVVRFNSLSPAERKEVVYIGRRGRGETGEFGNPYLVGPGQTVEQAVQKYRVWLYKKITSDPEYARKIYALKGRKLGCPGNEPNDECHGQVILRAIEWLEKNPKFMEGK